MVSTGGRKQVERSLSSSHPHFFTWPRQIRRSFRPSSASCWAAATAASADIYALGVLLIDLLTGTPASGGGSSGAAERRRAAAEAAARELLAEFDSSEKDDPKSGKKSKASKKKAPLVVASSVAYANLLFLPPAVDQGIAARVMASASWVLKALLRLDLE